MENHDDHESLTDFPIDSDYIDNEQQRADIDVSDEKVDEYERDPQFLPPKQSTDLSHTYGRQAGDGVKNSIEEEIDQRTVPERGNRGDTRTGMDINEADGYYAERIIRNGNLRTRAGWLKMLQDGYMQSEWREEGRKMDNQRWMDTFASKLDLTSHQRKRVERIIKSVRLDHFASYTVEIIVLAAIKIVTKDDDRHVSQEKTFLNLIESIDYSQHDIKRCEELLTEKSNLL